MRRGGCARQLGFDPLYASLGAVGLGATIVGSAMVFIDGTIRNVHGYQEDFPTPDDGKLPGLIIRDQTMAAAHISERYSSGISVDSAYIEKEPRNGRIGGPQAWCMPDPP